MSRFTRELKFKYGHSRLRQNIFSSAPPLTEVLPTPVNGREKWRVYSSIIFTLYQIWRDRMTKAI